MLLPRGGKSTDIVKATHCFYNCGVAVVAVILAEAGVGDASDTFVAFVTLDNDVNCAFNIPSGSSSCILNLSKLAQSVPSASRIAK